MLKRSGALLLILLYAVTVYGIALDFHYCGKLLTSVTVNSPSKSCGMFAESKMKCCKDKQIKIKVKDAHQAVFTSFVAKTVVADIARLLYGNFIIGRPEQIGGKLANKAPPDIPQLAVPVFLKNQSFRI
jgi:hypothetical protein